MKDEKDITIESYNKIAEEFKKRTENKHPKKESTLFLSHLPKGSKILDLGCAYGRDSKIFADKGYKVIGIDLSKELIKIAKKEVSQAEFKVMDMLELDFPDNYFDGVWFNAGILMVKKEKAPEVIKKIYQILKPGGVLYINAKKGEGEGWSFDERYQIEKFRAYYQEDELKSLLTQFEILKSWSNRHSESYHKRIWIEFLCKK